MRQVAKRKAGAAPLPKAAAKGKAKAQPCGKQGQIVMQTFAIDASSGTVKVGSTTCVAITTACTLSALQQEALNEIVTELCQNRYKIFVTNRIVFNESYFQQAEDVKGDWWHWFIVKLADAPKSEWSG